MTDGSALVGFKVAPLCELVTRGRMDEITVVSGRGFILVSSFVAGSRLSASRSCVSSAQGVFLLVPHSKMLLKTIQQMPN